MSWSRPIHAFHPIARKVANLNLASIAGGNTASLTETVRGARPGMAVIIQAALPDGLILHSERVSANDTVAYKVTNVTGSAIDPPAMDFTFIVF